MQFGIKAQSFDRDCEILAFDVQELNAILN